MNKRAALPLTIIIIAALGLVVFVVILNLTGLFSGFGTDVAERTVQADTSFVDESLQAQRSQPPSPFAQIPLPVSGLQVPFPRVLPQAPLPLPKPPGQVPIPVRTSTSYPLYGVYETTVTNNKNYANPFDYTKIELQATFTSPSGVRTPFFGFYDGDGNGGQTGNVWKLRFMPNEVGVWTYSYTWSDGTAGGSGSFGVIDTGLPGPLKEASDNPWYFETSRGVPFDFRGYGMHHYLYNGNGNDKVTVVKNQFIADIQSHAIDAGYNMIMIDAAFGPDTHSSAWKPETWWEATDTSYELRRFDLAVWHAYEDIFDFTSDNQVYVFPFAGMITPGKEYAFNDFKVFLHYWVARFGPYYNFMGYSPTWEWWKTTSWSEADVSQIMQYVYDNNPFPTLLTVHASSRSSFTNWMGFTMREKQSQYVFEGNCRLCGYGLIQPPFDQKPIIGSEDIWEISSGAYGNPRSPTEVRRGAWGIMMAGVMPLYSEWTQWTDTPGDMPGEPEIIRMFDFFYSKTNYRQYQQLNSLVSSSARQVASGIPGQEYLVYDENGGSVRIDLSGTSSSKSFDVLWFDPKNGNQRTAGTVNGGASRTLSSPFISDSVLLLKASS